MISSSGSSVTGAGGSAHVHTRGGSVGSLSDTEVHADLLAIQFRVRHGISGFGGILNFVKSNESKASGSASFAIQYNCYFSNWSKFTKFFLQLPFCSVKTETKNSEASVGLRGITVSFVSPTV